MSLDPEAGKAFLDDLFGIGCGFGHGQCEGEQAFAENIEQDPECMLVACSDPVDEITGGIRVFVDQSVPLWCLKVTKNLIWYKKRSPARLPGMVY